MGVQARSSRQPQRTYRGKGWKDNFRFFVAVKNLPPTDVRSAVSTKRVRGEGYLGLFLIT